MAVLNGSASNNVIIGKSSRDTLYGNGGNDTLIGGHGKDILWGGAGADTFKFVDDYDSKHWENNWDTIMDFRQGDKIDLSTIDANEKIKGNQNFSFGSAGGDAKIWLERQGGDTYVNAKIGGGTWIEIKLDNYTGQLDASDFVF